MISLLLSLRPEPPCESSSDPVVMAIMDCCTKLYLLIRQWNSQHRDTEVGDHSHASNCIASDVKQLIISWFANGRMVNGNWHTLICEECALWVQESPVEVDQLRRDKEELLNQLVSLQQQQEAAAAESSKLCKKVSFFRMKFAVNCMVGDGVFCPCLKRPVVWCLCVCVCLPTP